MRNTAIAEFLGAHVAMQEPRAKLWLRVTRGELSVDEAISRHFEALAPDFVDEPAAVERAKQVFSPPSQAHRAVVLKTLRAQLQRRRRARGATVIPLDGTRRKITVFTVAAAAVLLFALPVIRPTQEPFSGTYLLEFEKAAVSVRGATTDDEIPRYLPSSSILIRLVPEQRVTGELEVTVFAWKQSGKVRRLQLTPRMLGLGVVEIDSTVAELGLDPGSWELMIAIGRPGTLPSSWQEVVDMDEYDKGPEIIRQRLDIVTHL